MKLYTTTKPTVLYVQLI